MGILRKKNFQLYIDNLRKKGGKLDLESNLEAIKVVHRRRVEKKAKPAEDKPKNNGSEAGRQAEAKTQHPGVKEKRLAIYCFTSM